MLFDENFIKSDEGRFFNNWLRENSVIYTLENEKYPCYYIGDMILYIDDERYYRILYNEYLEFKKTNEIDYI